MLGVSIGTESNFPVGEVNFLSLFPMSFSEYLLAAGEELFIKTLRSMDSINPFPEAIHEKMLYHLKLYLFLGGIPEVIDDYLENRDIANARSIQKDILAACAGSRTHSYTSLSTCLLHLILLSRCPHRGHFRLPLYGKMGH